MRWINRFTDFFRRLIAWFRPDNGGTAYVAKARATQPPVTPQPEQAAPRPKPDDGAPKPPHPPPRPAPPPPVEPPRPAAGNRKTRRALKSQQAKQLERERRKLDKFVTPQGPQPVKIERAKPIKREKPLATPADYQEQIQIIYDVIDGKEVLVEESEVWGVFNFRDTILDQLDRYWVYLDRMRKYDPDSYGFYKQIGAVLVPSMGTQIDTNKKPIEKLSQKEIDDLKKETYLPPWFKTHRPSFGCVAYGANPKAEALEDASFDKKGNGELIPKFLYYTKYRNPPPEVQPMTGGDIYSMCVWWDRPHDKKIKWGVPQKFAVFISTDGETIQPLRCLDTKWHAIRGKHGHDRGHIFHIPERAWHMPETYVQWAKSYGITPELHLAHLFCAAVRREEHTHYAMVRVEVHKDDMTAVFSIDVKRLGYFFQDRDIVLTESGVKKPIFHSVRPHVRKNGVPVRMHTKGLREFDWAGTPTEDGDRKPYRVKISVPALHHFMLPEVDVGASDDYWIPKEEKATSLTEPQWAAKLVEEMAKEHVRPWKE